MDMFSLVLNVKDALFLEWY